MDEIERCKTDVAYFLTRYSYIAVPVVKLWLK